MLFCDSKGQCLFCLVNLAVVTVYSHISDVPQLTAFSFMWHVALQCHAGGDVLLTFPLFSYCREVVQNVSQLTHRKYV